MGDKLKKVKIVGNYVKSLQQQYPELARLFNMNKDILFNDMQNSALNLESTSVVSKARNDEATANVVESK